MSECSHSSLELVGTQRTDEGTNSYYTCEACGDMVVISADLKVFSLKSSQRDSSPPRADRIGES